MKYIYALLAVMAIIVFGVSVITTGLGLLPKSIGLFCAACSAASVWATTGQIYD